jgi:proline utilization trans-activator
MSAIMKPSAMNSDLLETLLSVLRSLKSNGNIPAVDFCERLSQIQARVSNLRATGRLESTTAGLHARFRHSDEMPIGRSPVSGTQEKPVNTPVSMQNEVPGLQPGLLGNNDIDVLGDPIIGSFLDGNQMQLLDAILPEGGIPNDWASDFDEQLFLGSW